MNKILKKILTGIFILALVVLAYGYTETFWLDIDPVIVRSQKLPDSFAGKKIVFASDFHCGIFFNEARIGRVVEIINALDPDIVILGGDYVDTDSRYIGPCVAQLGKIQAKEGVWGALGNRDYSVDPDKVRKAMTGAGIRLLENGANWVTIANERIRVAGVADFLQAKAQIALALPDGSDPAFTVLISHNPLYINRIPDSKADLVLSGHTHGGQVSFFGLWIPIFNFKYGHKYVSGIYEKNGTIILVSRGVGTRLLPLRFFARPEINVITLEKN